MKSYLYSLLYGGLSCLLLQNCTKDNTTPADNTGQSAQENLPGVVRKTERTLTLQPGPEDGDDTWLTFKQGDPSYAATNWDTVNATYAYAWTSGGIPIRGRSLIKFDGLSVLSASSKVISARLYMYGIPSSARLTSGNSIYPGTPYYLDNSMTVLRVAQPWQQSVVTWQTQPPVVLAGRVVIPFSTAQWNYDANVDVTEMVTYMVSHPDKNYGFLFRMATEEVYKCMMFSSSNYSIPSRRPKLIVTYQ